MAIKINYVAIFTKEENGAYLVRFPDLRGCFAYGDSFDDAFVSAESSLYKFVSSKKIEDLPKATEYDQVAHSNKDCIVQIVPVEINSSCNEENYVLIKKTLTIPTWLNDIATKHRINFSEVLKQALIDILKNEKNLMESNEMVNTKI